MPAPAFGLVEAHTPVVAAAENSSHNDLKLQYEHLPNDLHFCISCTEKRIHDSKASNIYTAAQHQATVHVIMQCYRVDLDLPTPEPETLERNDQPARAAVRARSTSLANQPACGWNIEARGSRRRTTRPLSTLLTSRQSFPIHTRMAT